MPDIATRLKSIQAQLPQEVTLIVVSKFHSVEAIQEAYDAGVRDFGENRVQELVSKVDQLPRDIRWHLIGSLQRNKVKYIAPFVNCIQSVDSLPLYEEIEKRAALHERTIDCLIEVHVAQEASKSGVPLTELEPFIHEVLQKEAAGSSHIRLRGLMGMATLTDSEETIRQEFTHLHQAFENLKKGLLKNKPHFDTLSMGMSSDWQWAIQEGSNMVRIGTAIMGSRTY